ncbi:MAG: hypothetical protein WBC12_02510 [Candidatus Saccharimonas aalborgensis]
MVIKPTMSLGDPISDKQAARLERVYEVVRGVTDRIYRPLNIERGDQHFVTEVAKYVIGVDTTSLDLPFNPEAIMPLGAKLTKRQRRLIGDVVYVWMRRFTTDYQYMVRLVLLARFARFSNPVRVEMANQAVGHRPKE